MKYLKKAIRILEKNIQKTQEQDVINGMGYNLMTHNCGYISGLNQARIMLYQMVHNLNNKQPRGTFAEYGRRVKSDRKEKKYPIRNLKPKAIKK